VSAARPSGVLAALPPTAAVGVLLRQSDVVLRVPAVPCVVALPPRFVSQPSTPACCSLCPSVYLLVQPRPAAVEQVPGSHQRLRHRRLAARAGAAPDHPADLHPADGALQQCLCRDLRWLSADPGE